MFFKKQHVVNGANVAERSNKIRIENFVIKIHVALMKLVYIKCVFMFM